MTATPRIRPGGCFFVFYKNLHFLLKPPSDEGGGFAEGKDGGREGNDYPSVSLSADSPPDKGGLERVTASEQKKPDLKRGRVFVWMTGERECMG